MATYRCHSRSGNHKFGIKRRDVDYRIIWKLPMFRGISGSPDNKWSRKEVDIESGVWYCINQDKCSRIKGTRTEKSGQRVELFLDWNMDNVDNGF